MNKTSYNVAIVGATGAVGEELIRVLSLTAFPVARLTLLASPRSAGKLMQTPFGSIPVKACDDKSLQGHDFVFFASGGSHARQFAPIAVKSGAVVIDNSSAFRLDPEVPLVVPEVNPKEAFKHRGIIANPNCSTIQMVVALAPIHRVSPIKRVQVATYQAVSGAGRDGITELEQQSKEGIDANPPKVFTKPIATNAIPHIDVFDDTGYTREEMKMVLETQKILAAPELKVSATCVRIPVVRAHSEAIWLETEEFIGAEKVRRLLSDAPGITLVDDPLNNRYPTPLEAAETTTTFVGRVRQDLATDNGILMWVVADQLWKGAALNAVQVAQLLIKGD